MARSKKEIEYENLMNAAKAELDSAIAKLSSMRAMFSSSMVDEAYYAAEKARVHMEDC